ncbi:hypothetical protein evm_002689 [Chilo suppressalis]|nr:hypothetical protein evm_002689 [Chilo suppressalis]
MTHNESIFQARFHTDVLRTDLRNSGLISSIFRPIVIIFFVMIFRMRFSVRRSDGVKSTTAARVGGVVALFATATLIAIATVDCGPGDIAGLTGGEFSSPTCSSECRCDTSRHGFIPVCGLESSVTYFSPCEAGCNATENLNEFHLFRGCSCDPEGVTRGACAIQRCYLHHTLYQVFVTLLLSFSGAAMLMQGMSLLRAVRNRDKVIAIGVMWAGIALTTDVLGHLLYFAIDHDSIVAVVAPSESEAASRCSLAGRMGGKNRERRGRFNNSERRKRRGKETKQKINKWFKGWE